MPSDASRAEARALAARDARQALLDRHAAAGHGAVVTVALNVPGPERAPPGAAALFGWALQQLAAALPGDRPVVLHAGDDALGPFALLAVRAAPAQAKAACLAVEAARPAARLVDLDVHAPGGGAVDRAALGLPPRPCLLCPAPASECIRLGRHPRDEVVARAHALLADLLVDAPPWRPRPALATDLLAGARRELLLTPKPGLVDLEDSGSHPDLTLDLMERSLVVLGEAYQALAASLERGEPLAAQLALGQAGEQRLLKRCGTNTHKGALFLGGLLLAARWRMPGHAGRGDLSALRPAVAGVAQELLEGRRLPPSHGREARRAFRVGGIVREALDGLPSLFEVALPAWEEARATGLAGDAAVFFVLARLMQVVEDTTTLHRGGKAGLHVLRADGLALEVLLLAGEDHLLFLRATNRAWRTARLTMGGVADLLGMALGLLAHRGLLPAPCAAVPPG